MLPTCKSDIALPCAVISAESGKILRSAIDEGSCMADLHSLTSVTMGALEILYRSMCPIRSADQVVNMMHKMRELVGRSNIFKCPQSYLRLKALVKKRLRHQNSRTIQLGTKRMTLLNQIDFANLIILLDSRPWSQFMSQELKVEIAKSRAELQTLPGKLKFHLMEQVDAFVQQTPTTDRSTLQSQNTERQPTQDYPIQTAQGMGEQPNKESPRFSKPRVVPNTSTSSSSRAPFGLEMPELPQLSMPNIFDGNSQ